MANPYVTYTPTGPSAPPIYTPQSPGNLGGTNSGGDVVPRSNVTPLAGGGPPPSATMQEGSEEWNKKLQELTSKYMTNWFHDKGAGGDPREGMEWARNQAMAELKNNQMTGATDYFYSESNRLAEQLGQGGYDPAQYSRYEQETIQPIERDFYEQANNTSAYLARQGLGSSGINLTSHGSLASNKAAVENSGRRQALSMAENAYRQRLMDEYSTRVSALGPVLQKYGVDINAYLQMQRLVAQMQYQQDMKEMAIFGATASKEGQMIGGAFGGPGGAQAGGEMGGSAGTMIAGGSQG